MKNVNWRQPDLNQDQRSYPSNVNTKDQRGYPVPGNVNSVPLVPGLPGGPGAPVGPGLPGHNVHSPDHGSTPLTPQNQNNRYDGYYPQQQSNKVKTPDPNNPPKVLPVGQGCHVTYLGWLPNCVLKVFIVSLSALHQVLSWECSLLEAFNAMEEE